MFGDGTTPIPGLAGRALACQRRQPCDASVDAWRAAPQLMSWIFRWKPIAQGGKSTDQRENGDMMAMFYGILQNILDSMHQMDFNDLPFGIQTWRAGSHGPF